MKDYYKIGEISKIYGIGRDSLMYYEELGILKPIRDTNGYRLYSISDIWKLNLIKELRTLNFSMKKIKDYIDNRNIEITKEVLKEEIHIIDKQIKDLSKQKENIINRLNNIDNVVNGCELYTIKVVYMNERKALKLNGDISRDEDVDFLVKKLQKKFEEKFYVLGNKNIGAIYDLNQLKENIYNQYKSVFCLLEDKEKSYNLLLEKGYYVTYSYRGAYCTNKEHLPKILEFIKENNYKIKSEPIEIYKIDVHETSLDNEYITEIQFPVEKY
ncbi:MerR family transcriptional regulator [Clostridium senegalense]|uniref:MerR family transcriptional regulator n=1 Tax=Clostridium senegalense TaxID=1465809 RepID=A0A6M0H7K8_9CLOT|nr:MerR family transcriptional regulator [Clostridium senegalense]NEU06023.1 MerR family transcriptional regulator [Clostridium senegalense]